MEFCTSRKSEKVIYPTIYLYSLGYICELLHPAVFHYDLIIV
uniref:Uncharacterized protein n=1 Tax=Rhizophora mucronata TaxID=61149 RepID=A0A2P2QCA5_RHIMU